MMTSIGPRSRAMNVEAVMTLPPSLANVHSTDSHPTADARLRAELRKPSMIPKGATQMTAKLLSRAQVDGAVNVKPNRL